MSTPSYAISTRSIVVQVSNTSSGIEVMLNSPGSTFSTTEILAVIKALAEVFLESSPAKEKKEVKENGRRDN
jgi:hypothetical protein